jgi:outer membrane protein TolC
METTAAYKPSFLVGSSLGYSYGFPVGQPSVASVGAQSLVFSFSQHDYVRSSRAALHAAQLKLKDMREATIFDTSLAYIELSKITRQVSALDQETSYVQRLVEIEDERVDAGVDNKIELTRVKLTEAQVALKRVQLLNQAQVLRVRLAHLTGLKPPDIEVAPGTVPQVPKIYPDFVTDSDVMTSNAGVQSAYASAKSKLLTALGDARQNNRPTINFGLEYNRYAEFNNYNEYYLRFQHNNFNVGIQIQLPLFDANRKAKAQQSSADAALASAQAEQLRDQTSEQTLQLQTSLTELGAQERVAELQAELAQDQVDQVKTELQSGSGNPSQPALTPKDEKQAQIDERNRYVEMLDAKFQLKQAQLNILRNLGRIEDWAKSAPAAKP